MLRTYISCVSLVAVIMICGCETKPTTDANAKPENSEKTARLVLKETEAKAGVGEKGKAYGGGMVTEPASQYWKIKERLAFDTVKHAEDLYKALNGNLPKTHEEYMKQIIDANRIKLPDLKAGLEYHYDAEKKMLMVRSKPVEEDKE